MCNAVAAGTIGRRTTLCCMGRASAAAPAWTWRRAPAASPAASCTAPSCRVRPRSPAALQVESFMGRAECADFPINCKCSARESLLAPSVIVLWDTGAPLKLWQHCSCAVHSSSEAAVLKTCRTEATT